MQIYDNGSRPGLAIFDLDGTLYPRERYVELVLDVIERGLVELHGSTPRYAREQVASLRQAMESQWDRTSTTAFMLAHGVGAGEWREFRTLHLDIAAGLAHDDQVVQAVARLRQHIPVALLTNNTLALANKILRKIGFPVDAFDAVISAEDVGTAPKPAPAAFQVVLDRFEEVAEVTWSIGDRYDIDVAALTQLGGAGVTVSGPSEIADAVRVLVERAVHRARNAGSAGVIEPDGT